jgi:uncharacterized membrane protein
MTTAASVDQPEPDGTAPTGTPLALRDPVDEPAKSDGFVRGLSESIGGPLGDFASRSGTSSYGGPRFWSVSRIVLAMICLTLSLHWVQKYPCNDGAWSDLKQYKYMCYTDVLALYYAEGLADGAVPYQDHPVEYPVVTGAFMGVIGLGVHALGVDNPNLNQGQLFYNLNALALGALGVAAAGMLLAVRKRRPWDVAMFALSPALFLSATVNWDLLAIALAVMGWVLWAKRYPAWAGVMIGLGASAKLWPALLAFPLLALCVRAGKLKEYGQAMGAGAVAIAVVNVPIALLWQENWMRFIKLNSERPIDWGTLWYIGDHFPRGGDQYGLEPFQWLGRHIPVLNTVTWVLIGASMVGIGVLILTAPRRPRMGQVAFLAVAAFLIFNKVWSQQFVLWLIPLVVLARPRWGAFLAWSFAEVAYFVAFYGQLMGASGKTVFPEWVFVLASMLRLGTVILLVVLVIREIRHPELDVVRHSYPDDPDGGVLDGAPDRREIAAEAPPPVPVPA